MESILILAGMLLVAGIFFANRAVGGEGQTNNPANGLRAMQLETAGSDMIGSVSGLDEQMWNSDHNDEVHRAFDAFGSSVLDPMWSCDAVVLDGMNYFAAVSIIDDSVVHVICINPATGLPMISDSEAGIDVGGNPYGFRTHDLHSHNDCFGCGFESGSSSHLGSGMDWM